MSTVQILKGQTMLVNSDLMFEIKNIKGPYKNLQLNEKTTNKTKELLRDAKENQQIQIKKYENDKKRYKILKKYGEVLHLIEKLMGIIPSDLNNLSVESLEEKLKELLDRRKKNEMQFRFLYYQNLLTDLLTNLVNIEKSYQSGKISSSQALAGIQQSKQEIKENSKDMPLILRPAIEEASYLVKLYEQSYASENKIANADGPTDLVTPSEKLKHEFLLEKLNFDTKSTIKRVNGLTFDLNKFEPQIDLTNLTSNLQATEAILKDENWDASKMKDAVDDLNSTTIQLTDKQVDLNKTNDKLSHEISSCVKQTSELAENSIKRFNLETYIDISKRAVEDKEITEQVVDILEKDENLSTTVGSQIANTIDAQIDADKLFISKNHIHQYVNKDLVNEFPLESAIEAAEEQNIELKDKVLTLEEKRELVIQLEKMKNDEDENDKKE